MPAETLSAFPPDLAAPFTAEAEPAVSFADKCLGDDGVRVLCARLAAQPRLTSLDLRGCHIHAPGAAAVAELVLRAAGRLSSLSLEWNAVGTDDAGAPLPTAAAPRLRVRTRPQSRAPRNERSRTPPSHARPRRPRTTNAQAPARSTRRSRLAAAPSRTSTYATTASPRWASRPWLRRCRPTPRCSRSTCGGTARATRARARSSSRSRPTTRCCGCRCRETAFLTRPSDGSRRCSARPARGLRRQTSRHTSARPPPLSRHCAACEGAARLTARGGAHSGSRFGGGGALLGGAASIIAAG